MIRLIYLFIVVTILCSHTTYAQSNLLSKQVNLSYSETRLDEVLIDMASKMGVRFSYSDNKIPLDAMITVEAENLPLKDALTLVFQNLPVSFVLLSNRIVLKYNDLRQTVRGTVVDKDSQSPLIGATVIILGTEPLQGGTTDIDGHFRIENVQLGRATIVVNFIGYEPLTIPQALVGSGKETILDLELVESIIKMEELVIFGEEDGNVPVNELATVSARSFTAEETRRYAVSVGDPGRLASAFPGVTGGDDGTNEIIIRGNTPRGLLWRLEGMEIPSPSHFSNEGASSGGISMLSTNMMARSDFFTGAFPAEYGNALSGVFDIRLRNGNNEKYEHTVQAGLLGLDLASEGPLSKGGKGSYLINYRYSTLAILYGLGLNVQDENEENTFQDISFKIKLPTSNIGTFSIFGLGGLSKFQRNLPSVFDDLETYDLGVVGVNHVIPVGKQSFIKTTLGLTGTSIDDKISNVISEDTLIVNSTEFRKSYITASSIFSNKVNAKFFFEAGVIYRRLNYDFFNEIDNPLNTPAFQQFSLFDESGGADTWQGYITGKLRLTQNLSIVGGVHALRFGFNSETTYEPRAGFQLAIGSGQTLSGGFGLHSRIESLEYYLGNFFLEDGTSVKLNEGLRTTKARHYVLGYERFFNSNLRFKIESYYQELYDVPVLRFVEDDPYSTILFSDGYISSALINAGKGENYGIELSIERTFNNGYYFMANGTIYEAKYTNRLGVERNSRYNGNFGANLLAGKEFKVNKVHIFGVNIKSTFAGNRRFVPIDLQNSLAQSQTVLDLTRAYEERYPNYFRIDLQVNFRKNKPKVTSEWRLDIQNVLNRQNVLESFYSNQLRGIATENQLGLIPVLSYRLEF